MIKPVGGMLLITKTEDTDKTTKSGLVISAAFNDSGPKSGTCLLYTSPSPRDRQKSRMPSSA